MFSGINTLVQVNCDWWIQNEDLDCNILLSKERRTKALRKLRRMDPVTLDVDNMLELYTEHPILNDLCIYVVGMVPCISLYFLLQCIMIHHYILVSQCHTSNVKYH
jgi:hypothetical protein